MHTIDNPHAQCWKTLIQQEKNKPYFQSLSRWLSSENASGKITYPPKEKILAAFRQTPFSQTRVVILGQDPYHGAGQANGLSFSVAKGVPVPPSLKNIFKEVSQSLDCKMPRHNGDLSSWAKQGVLLLNTVLTVEHAKPQSHRNRGWETFTDAIIDYLNQSDRTIIFLLWGTPARKKKHLINQDKHKILEAPHPSPLSAHRGFFGCDHFNKVNQILSDTGQKTVNWAIDE